MTVSMTWDYSGWFAEMARRGTPLSGKAKQLMLTNSNRTTAEHWHHRFIPRHFQSGNHSRYQMKARKAPYRRIKVGLAQGKQYKILDGENVEIIDDRVIKGGTVSLVRGGSTEQKAKRRGPIRANPKGAVAKVLTNRYVAIRRRSDRPNQRRELQTITSAERRELHGVWSASFFDGVHSLGRSAFRIRHQSK